MNEGVDVNYEGRAVEMEEQTDDAASNEDGASRAELEAEIARLADQLEQIELLYLNARAEAIQRKRAMEGR